MKLPKNIQKFFAAAGSKGGKKRTKNLSAAKRSKIAKKAAEARWGKKGKKS